MKLRWNEAELNEVKAAADDVKEAAALFIRSAALMRSRAKAKAKRLRAKAKAMETDYPLNAVRIEGMAEAYEKIASGK